MAMATRLATANHSYDSNDWRNPVGEVKVRDFVLDLVNFFVYFF